MSCFPLLSRELLSESRRPLNYWFRSAAAALGAACALLALWKIDAGWSQVGAHLFRVLTLVTFLGVWAAVPLITADCISREKRDGTLGLLFLTPLTARGVVAGKGLSQGIRVLGLFLAMAPVLCMPFLFGGVSWRSALTSACLIGASLILAITCGIVASALSRLWIRAMALAEILGWCAGVGFMRLFAEGCFWFYWQTTLPTLRGGASGWRYEDLRRYLLGVELGNPLSQLGSQLGLIISGGSFDVRAGGGGPGYADRVVLLSTGLLILAVLGLIAGLAVAAAWVKRAWREEGRSRRQDWVFARFCTPLFWRSFFKSRMSRRLDRNPVGWLQVYSWSARLTKWGWCFFVILAEILLIGDASLRSLIPGQAWLAALVMAGLAFSAASSFQRERESGALELLLVTPLKELQLIEGRVRGVLGQFLPATGLLLGVWIYIYVELGGWFSRVRTEIPLDVPLFLTASFLLVPVIGLYFSMRRLNIVVGWILTCAAGLAVPLLIGRLAGSAYGVGAALFAQLTVAVVCAWRLWVELRSRQFALERA